MSAVPELFDLILAGMTNKDPLIRMRRADAAEKITVRRPHFLQLYKDELIHRIAAIWQQEVCWHLAQLFSD